MKKDKTGGEGLYAVTASPGNEPAIQERVDEECEVCGKRPAYIPVEDGAASLCKEHLEASYTTVILCASLKEAEDILVSY